MSQYRYLSRPHPGHLHVSIYIQSLLPRSFISHWQPSERFAFSSCNKGPVTSQAETPKKWLYWDQKIENHDDWIMNYHGVQLQPRLLEALIGCLQFFPEHMKCLSPWTSPSQVHKSQPRSTGRTQRCQFVPKKPEPECGFRPISDCLSKITTPSIELSSASTPQRIQSFGLCLSETPIQRRLTKTK
jgi:hypothetical protein